MLFMTSVYQVKANESVTENLSSYIQTQEVNVAKDNSKFKVSLFDVTDRKIIQEKSDNNFSKINNGNKTINDFLELVDTDNRSRHSRYVQLDLGESYRLFKIHLYRYLLMI